ncbi:MAG: HEAT repeat domain-containing protein [Deltaproteobacteria bacterium]|nr:HEAT repeat domain-containing protein [Deltaproteobacteria bacterium]
MPAPRLRPLIAALGLTGAACRGGDPTDGGPPAAPGFRLGNEYRYTLHMVSEADLAADEPMFQFDLRGKLAATPVELGVNRQVVALRLVEPHFEGSPTPEAAARFDEVRRELEVPSSFTFERGALRDSRLPQNASILTIGILRNVAASLQFAAPPGDTATWVAEEYDATGRYVAQYARSAGEGHFTKRKLKYASLLAEEKPAVKLLPGTPALPAFTASEGSVVLALGFPKSLQAKEVLTTTLTGASELRVTTSFVLVFESQTTTPPVDLRALEAATRPLSAGAPYVHASGTFDLDASKMGRLGFDEIVSAIESVAKDKPEPTPAALNGKAAPPDKVEAGEAWAAQRNRYFTALAATFRKKPETIPRALAIVRSPSPAGEAMISALGAAGSEEAQAALVSLMTDEALNRKQRKLAGLSLVRTKVPTVFAARELEKLLPDPFWREYATYGLGTYARRLGETGNAAEKERLGQLLVGILKDSKDRPSRLDALAGISNSGYPGALASVLPLVANQDPLIRGAAVQALRLMDHADVDRLLIAATEDADLTVRATAIQSMGNRTPTTALGAAVAKRALEDTTSRVRMQAVQLLVRWQSTLPELRNELKRVSERDTDEAIQRLAAAELKAPSTAP